MTENNIHPFNEQLRERTFKMAVNVRNLLLTVDTYPIDKPIVNQLIRSSSSVAANYRAANCARSESEFLSKISIVLEETDETKFWIEYLQRINVLKKPDTDILLLEMDELVRIFSSIRKKMKEKLGK